MTIEIKICSNCGKKLSRPLRVKAGFKVTCGICFSAELEDNSFEMNEISNYNLRRWV